MQDGDQKLVNGATVFYTGRVGDDELVKLLKEKNVEFMLLYSIILRLFLLHCLGYFHF